MKLWVRRHRDLSQARNQLACRLHALLRDLVAGGVRGEIHANKVDHVLEGIEPGGPVAAARVELARDLVADLRRLDGQLADTKKRLGAVVAASKTTTTDVFGVGPVDSRMRHDARQAAVAANRGPGGQPRNDSDASATGSHPETPALRPSHSRTLTHPTPPQPDLPQTIRTTP